MGTLFLTKEARIYNGAKTASSINGAGKAVCKRMKSEHFLTPYTKINSKWIKDLFVRPETIKFLEENTGKTVFDINCSKILYDLPTRVMEIKTKIYKWDLLLCCAAKSLQSCPTLCNPIDGSPPDVPAPGILQARTLEWVAISFSNA